MSSWNDRFIREKCYTIDNDRFKEKKYIYSPFPEAASFGFQDGNIRSIVLADVMARFLRMENQNVLFPTGTNGLTMSSFMESKKMYKVLDDGLSNVFYQQMSKLGVGINDMKHINMRHNEYLAILQKSFIDLYERNYIRYKIASPYFDKDNNRIYDYMESDGNLPRSSMKCFVLDIDGLIPEVVRDIKKLPIEDKYKNELIDKLNPSVALEFELQLSNGALLEVMMEEPEYLGGLSYIFLNPEYIDIIDYVSHDEFGSVQEYLETSSSSYVYSGLYAKNPLTGEDVPVFISSMYPKGIYLGIPDIDEDDALLVEQEGFDYPKILDNGILIHSDMLDGYTIEEGKRKIIEAFTDAEFAKVNYIYRNNEIILSSLEPFGALVPFLEDKKKLNALKDYLPYAFSMQFRPVLSENVNVSGLPISGTISHLFTEGVCSLLSVIYDDIGSVDSLFSVETKELYEAWLPIHTVYIPEKKLTTDVLMPIILYNIIKKEISYTLPELFSNMKIIPRALDVKHRSMKRSHNNLMDMDAWVTKYGSDALRFLAVSTPINEEMIYDSYRLSDLKDYLSRMKSAISSFVTDEVPSLDYHFSKLASYLKDALEQSDIALYMELLKKFNETLLFHSIISKKQALDYLKVIYPVFPEMAEELYKNLFHGKYSILNEGWPN